MYLHGSTWICANGCRVFEVIGTPTYCPYCANRELYPHNDDEMEVYDRRFEFQVTNDGPDDKT